MEKTKWLVTAKLTSGEYSQDFYKIFEAEDETHLNLSIDDYFGNYYDDKDPEHPDEWTWLFHCGCVMVQVKEVRPLDVDTLIHFLTAY